MNYFDSSATSYSSSASVSSSDNNNKNNRFCDGAITIMPDRDFNYAPTDASERAVAKGGVACPFPWRLHEMLKVSQEEGLEHIVSWAPHGKAFMVNRPLEFAELIMTRFFCQTKFASFQRQLNLYGFSRFCHGRDKGAYYHSCFIRGHRTLVRQMIRRKIKGTNAALRRPLPTEEPNFYQDDNNSGNNNSAITVSPIPPCVSYQSTSMSTTATSARAISHGEEEEEELVLINNMTAEDGVDEDNLAFFAGSPFHFVEEEEEAIIVAEPPSIMMLTPLDPAAELAKIRAQIRQKQAEYERRVGYRHQPLVTTTTTTRRVSWEQQQQPAPTNNKIPVYKGSYIAV